MTDVPIAAPALGDAEREGVLSVLDSGQIAAGGVVDTFEDEFAAYCGTEHGVATANGTAALETALRSFDVDGSVVTTPFSFVATANAVRFAGATPVFADVDPGTYNFDPDAVESILREREDVDAILAVHLYGLPAPMDRLRELADEHDVALIEDAAQAHGARYRGEPAGSLGDAACFSFYPTKNMTTGEGGMITTDRDEVAERTRRFIDHGRGDGTYEHVELGHNFRMTNLAAAIGRAQLDRLPGFVTARRENARLLDERLAGVPVLTPIEPDGYRHAYHQYTIRSRNRDAVAEALAERGVDSAIYYPTPIHRLEAFSDFDAEAPVAEALANEVLSIPVHPGVERSDIETITETVSEAVSVRV